MRKIYVVRVKTGGTERKFPTRRKRILFNVSLHQESLLSLILQVYYIM